MSLDLKTLIDKLNPFCRLALEEAAGLCVANTHYNVEIEHFLAKLLELPESQDLACLEVGLGKDLPIHLHQNLLDDFGL